MRLQFRFLFVVLCLVAVSILAVYLRTDVNYTFYKLYSIQIQQSRLKQQLGNKQLELESLINPAAVSQRLSKQQTEFTQQ